MSHVVTPDKSTTLGPQVFDLRRLSPLATPANAAVFSVDEKPQIQALERTAPVLPMIPGVPERRSFGYVRHGTIDLFAALNIATGKVIGKLSAQHRAMDRFSALLGTGNDDGAF